MTPAARPAVAARWARLTCTGAAAARLAVKTPAAGTGRPSVRGHHGHVGRATGLDARRAPGGDEPRGAVTLTGTPRHRQPGGLGQAEHQVGALDGLARRALHEVVEGAQTSDPAGAGVDPGGDLGRSSTRRWPWSRRGRR